MKRQYVSDIGGNSSLHEIAQTLHIPMQTVRNTLRGALAKIFVVLLEKFTVEELYEMLSDYRDRNVSAGCENH